jgi:glycosyltransferase involved in cell wall biosynthesis
MLATLAAARSESLTQHFAVSPASRLSRELREAGTPPVALPRARASRPLSVLMARRDFGRTLADLQPDAAIFHGSWTHAIYATVARERGLLVAFWQHAPITNPGWPDRWAAWTAPDIVFANSRFTAAAPAFRGAHTQIIYCPVPVLPAISAAQRGAGRAALGARETDVVVLMAARLEAWKGHRVLIEAARLLADGAVKIWIAGGVQRPSEQAYFEQLQADVSASGVHASVSLIGERDDVAALMQLADVYCQPNTAPEPFGIAIAEAMRAGLPCVISNGGGAAELVDGECGILVTPGDAAGVSAAISRLAADPAQRGAMGRAASARAARMTDPAGRVAELAAALSIQPAHAG